MEVMLSTKNWFVMMGGMVVVLSFLAVAREPAPVP